MACDGLGVNGTSLFTLLTNITVTRAGTPIVDACVRLGADYVDITGETPWVKVRVHAIHPPCDQCVPNSVVSVLKSSAVPCDL